MLGWLVRRLVQKSESTTGVEYTARRRRETRPHGVELSFGNLFEFAVLRDHALRALCGALMDRHTDCEREHPFCGPGHQQDGDSPTQFLAQAVEQRDGAVGGELIGIYLTPATAGSSKEGESIVEYAARMSPTSDVPNRKLVVSPPDGGVYPALYGPIREASGGAYPTGRLDPAGNNIPFDCVYRPDHCRWQYWESELTGEGRVVPVFNCLQLFGQWWIVEGDAVSGVAQQVAALDFADNPNHI